MTRIPPDLDAKAMGKALVVAENVRAEKGQLRAAPGFERVNTPHTQLGGEANLIYQPNITSTDQEVRKMPIVGTETQLLTLKKRSRPLVCPAGCSIRFAAVADSGDVGANTANVAAMVRGWSPDLVVHAGDLVYADGGSVPTDNIYEEQVARHYWWALGGYAGPYGRGPATNKFFPAPGNHDWDDGPGYRFFSFFGIPTGQPYYTIKRGPVQFFFIDSYGYGPLSTGPGGNPILGTGAAVGVGQSNLSSTGPQAVWLQTALAASDCPWRVVVWHHPPDTSENTYYPGYAVMQWPLKQWGADLLITGHSHVYERLLRADGLTHLIVGLGGHSKRSFVSTPLPTSQFRYAADYGALKVDAGQTTLIAKFYSQDGTQQDSVTLTTSRPLSVCYTGGQSRQAVGLRVVPPSASSPVGVRFPFQAVAVFSDGTSQDVTTLCSWSSLDIGVATVDTTGGAKGAKAGTATIRASFQGFTASATFTVLASCYDTPHDVVLVLDRSGSMRYTAPPNGTRIDRLKQAANLFLDTLKTTDRVQTISFSGDDFGYFPKTVVHHDFTNDFSVSRKAIATLIPSGGTGTYDAVNTATLNIEKQGRKSSEKLIALFTDGFANIAPGCPPSNVSSCAMSAVTAAANTAKALGIKIAVIGFDLKYSTLWEPVVQSWATCPNLYYSVVTGDELLQAFARLRNDVCVHLCSSGSGVGLGLI